jgi:hypothetical protein
VRLASVALLVALLGAAVARGSTFAFLRTPSGNIGCAYFAAGGGVPASLRCDIRSGLRPKPPRPPRCELDYGDSYELRSSGRATIVCHGDTVFDPRAQVLAYGRTWTRAGFRCTSRTSGLRCTNRAGHGFLLSRERSYRF